MFITCPLCLAENPDSTPSCICCGTNFTTSSYYPYHLPSVTLLKQGRYRVENVISEDGFSIIYKGFDLLQSKNVAIKEYWPEKGLRQGNIIIWPNSITPIQQKQQIQELAKEAGYMARVSHPNISTVFDCFEENNTAYLVKEFINGKTLYNLLKKEGRLPENRVRYYFLQVAEALKILHSCNLLHRDIKPDNIIITQNDRAILTDFFLVREFAAGRTEEMDVILTQGYAPLEQYARTTKRWPATDIYAFCASMYELLTGQMPPAATDRIPSENLIPPRQLVPHISPQMEQVILKGLKIKIEERFQTADELILALNQVFGQNTQPTPITQVINSYADDSTFARNDTTMLINCPYCSAENYQNAIICITCGSPLTSMQSDGIHLPTGTILQQGKYQVQRLLGRGGFGITYLGFDLVNSRNIAIKENLPERSIRQGTTIIWPSTITPEERRRQLTKVITEAKFLSKCVHSNVVKVYDWFEENNTAYIVMSFIPGKPLSKVLEEEGILPSERVKRYFIQVAEALKVIHAANLLHRDIKPDNIIIDHQDRAILIDFGATKEFIASQTRQSSITLTPGYAPLEQYSYRSKRLPATDIYAFCASMYELLTGQLPSEAPDRVLSDTLIPPRQLVPQISPLLDQVIMKGMKLRVEERFQTAEELIRALTIGNQTAKLIPIQPVNFQTEFLLDKSQLIIGRFEDGMEAIDINLDNFPGANTVSRPHAEIYREAGQWKIKDLASSNGTFIKRAGQSRFSPRITAPEILTSGDEIAFGKVRFRFQNI